MKHARTLLAATALALLPTLADATSYVLPSDAALADRAEVIARVRVDAVEPAPDRAALDYRVTLDRTLKGDRTGSVTVRVPGGPAPYGLALEVDGAPRLEAGQHALLFLRRNEDGTYRIAHVILGAFVEIDTGRERLAVRDLGDAVEIPTARSGGSERNLPRDLDRFEAWLADRAAGVQRSPDYFVSTERAFSAERAAADKSSELRGPKVRWFRFEGPRISRNVDWLIDPLGQAGLPNRGRQEFRSALRAWNGLRGSTIHYRAAGFTDADGGLSTFDGINAIRYEVDFGDPYDCQEGGTLAIGGAWYDDVASIKFRGTRYGPILGGDIIVNQGIACFFEASPDPRAAARELYAHELGHTLGLHHSCGDQDSGACRSTYAFEALMRAGIHDDRRGAYFAQADKDAICTLYPDARLTTEACAAQ